MQSSMLTEDYTTAVLELLGEGKTPESVIKRLKESLTRKGHTRLLPRILKRLLIRIEAEEGALVPQVTLAKAKDENAHKEKITHLLESLSTNSDYTLTIDETIVGGVVVKHEDKIIDASYKKQLLTLYRTLTS